MISTLGGIFNLNHFDQSSRATDVIVIRHRDGSLHSTPFNIRFGRAKIWNSVNKVVQLEVNGSMTSAVMKIGKGGEAYWLHPATNRPSTAAPNHARSSSSNKPASAHPSPATADVNPSHTHTPAPTTDTPTTNTTHITTLSAANARTSNAVPHVHSLPSSSPHSQTNTLQPTGEHSLLNPSPSPHATHTLPPTPTKTTATAAAAAAAEDDEKPKQDADTEMVEHASVHADDRAMLLNPRQVSSQAETALETHIDAHDAHTEDHNMGPINTTDNAAADETATDPLTHSPSTPHISSSAAAAAAAAAGRAGNSHHHHHHYHHHHHHHRVHNVAGKALAQEAMEAAAQAEKKLSRLHVKDWPFVWDVSAQPTSSTANANTTVAQEGTQSVEDAPITLTACDVMHTNETTATQATPALSRKVNTDTHTDETRAPTADGREGEHIAHDGEAYRGSSDEGDDEDSKKTNTAHYTNTPHHSQAQAAETTKSDAEATKVAADDQAVVQPTVPSSASSASSASFSGDDAYALDMTVLSPHDARQRRGGGTHAHHGHDALDEDDSSPQWSRDGSFSSSSVTSGLSWKVSSSASSSVLSSSSSAASSSSASSASSSVASLSDVDSDAEEEEGNVEGVVEAGLHRGRRAGPKRDEGVPPSSASPRLSGEAAAATVRSDAARAHKTSFSSLPLRLAENINASNTASSAAGAAVDTGMTSTTASSTAAAAPGAGAGYFLRSLIPTAEDLRRLNLHDGCNSVRYLTRSTFDSPVVAVHCNIFLWNDDARLVVSDVDGTITRSDIWGHFYTMLGKGAEWTHPGICSLFTKIVNNGYHMIYLTARSMTQVYWTKNYLWSLTQDGQRLPLGPVLTAPQRIFTALTKEVSKQSHVFKIACLKSVQEAFPSHAKPFFAGFGNRYNDLVSYSAVNIPTHKIFIIDPTSVLHVCRVKQTYRNLTHLVDVTFPPVRSRTSHGRRDGAAHHTHHHRSALSQNDALNNNNNNNSDSANPNSESRGRRNMAAVSGWLGDLVKKTNTTAAAAATTSPSRQNESPHQHHQQQTYTSHPDEADDTHRPHGSDRHDPPFSRSLLRGGGGSLPSSTDVLSSRSGSMNSSSSSVVSEEEGLNERAEEEDAAVGGLVLGHHRAQHQHQHHLYDMSFSLRDQGALAPNTSRPADGGATAWTDRAEHADGRTMPAHHRPAAAAAPAWEDEMHVDPDFNSFQYWRINPEDVVGPTTPGRSQAAFTPARPSLTTRSNTVTGQQTTHMITPPNNNNNNNNNNSNSNSGAKAERSASPEVAAMGGEAVTRASRPAELLQDRPTPQLPPSPRRGSAVLLPQTQISNSSSSSTSATTMSPAGAAGSRTDYSAPRTTHPIPNNNNNNNSSSSSSEGRGPSETQTASTDVHAAGSATSRSNKFFSFRPAWMARRGTGGGREGSAAPATAHRSLTTEKDYYHDRAFMHPDAMIYQSSLAAAPHNTSTALTTPAAASTTTAAASLVRAADGKTATHATSLAMTAPPVVTHVPPSAATRSESVGLPAETGGGVTDAACCGGNEERHVPREGSSVRKEPGDAGGAAAAAGAVSQWAFWKKSRTESARVGGGRSPVPAQQSARAATVAWGESGGAASVPAPP